MRAAELPRKTLKGLIFLYTYLISPLWPPSCRYQPTCSSYAMEAVERHGALKGAVLAIGRILRCHPWRKAEMLDPVPASIAWPEIIGYNTTHCKTFESCGCERPRKKEQDHAKP